jgi:hypothetical protein
VPRSPNRNASPKATPKKKKPKKKKPKKKKDQLSLAQYKGIHLANRPDPDDPGGLGAEESGIERTGPTRCLLVAIQKGGR